MLLQHAVFKATRMMDLGDLMLIAAGSIRRSPSLPVLLQQINAEHVRWNAHLAFFPESTVPDRLRALAHGVVNSTVLLDVVQMSGYVAAQWGNIARELKGIEDRYGAGVHACVCGWLVEWCLAVWAVRWYAQLWLDDWLFCDLLFAAVQTSRNTSRSRGSCRSSRPREARVLALDLVQARRRLTHARHRRTRSPSHAPCARKRWWRPGTVTPLRS